LKEPYPIIWALTDDRAGNVNQVLGVAEALGAPFEIKEIRYNKYGSLPNIIRGTSLLGIDLEKSSNLTSPLPDIVIGAGRKTAPVSRYIKKASSKKTKLIQLMWPGFPTCSFDLIATPTHDGIKADGRIINIIGAPNRISSELLKKHSEKWQDKFANLTSPKVALLVGGNTKRGAFTGEHARELALKVAQFFEGKTGSLLITNSRRTSEQATKILKDEIKIQSHFHDCRSGNENPFFGYLAVCDSIIVSGDSISMCSEACSTGKPVYIYAPDNITPDKHKKFHQNLYQNGYAKPLTGLWSDWNYSPLNDAKMIANLIRENYF
jgi:mitochondrial fission protein ELM1